ncbi:MAG: DUF3352 domain-containing protein [Dermatophilus congolensis]|nr:DUF3352 domain-containing protein [Dermatophilus congolensis]
MSEATTPTANSTAVKGKSSKGLIIGGGVVALALAGLGGAYAAGVFDGVTGGGKQPADVIPSTSIAYMRVDLNPSAAQKVGAFRLLDKLPDAKAAFTATDPKRAVFEWMKKDNADLKDIDYTNDIEPWLGDRIGGGLLPASGSGSEPVPIVAVEVKDEAKAEEGLKKLEAAAKPAVDKAKSEVEKAAPGTAVSGSSALGGSEESVRIYTDGYALIVPKDNEQQVRDQLAAGRLAANENFTGDMKALGDEGVASAWYDQPALMQALNTGSTPAAMDELAQMAGRSALGLRFASDYVEVGTVSRGVTQPTVPAVAGIGDLPGDTGAVYSFAGGEQLVTQYWPTMLSVLNASGMSAEDGIKQAEDALGIKLPDDLGTLLGKQFDIVVAKQDFSTVNTGVPVQVAARLTTDTAKAETIITQVQSKLAGMVPNAPTRDVPRKVVGDKLIVAADTAYLDKLASPQGKLSDNQGFQRTVPDPNTQAGVLFVDLDAFESQYLDQVEADQREFVQSLQGLGMVNGPVNNGESKGSLRLSVN